MQEDWDRMLIGAFRRNWNRKTKAGSDNMIMLARRYKLAFDDLDGLKRRPLPSRHMWRMSVIKFVCGCLPIWFRDDLIDGKSADEILARLKVRRCETKTGCEVRQDLKRDKREKIRTNQEYRAALMAGAIWSASNEGACTKPGHGGRAQVPQW